MNVGRPRDEPDALRVTLLGTGWPKPQPGRTGPAALVEAAGKWFVFDCGRCTLQRLEEAGVPLGELKYLFLTHLHSDHIVGIPDFWLTPWIFGRGNEPLRVWGPEGTRRMMSKLAEAFEFDIHLRRGVDERLDPGGVEVIAEDVEQEDLGWGTADHWMRMQASYELAQARRDRAAAERRTGALDA